MRRRIIFLLCLVALVAPAQAGNLIKRADFDYVPVDAGSVPLPLGFQMGCAEWSNAGKPEFVTVRWSSSEEYLTVNGPTQHSIDMDFCSDNQEPFSVYSNFSLDASASAEAVGLKVVKIELTATPGPPTSKVFEPMTGDRRTIIVQSEYLGDFKVKQLTGGLDDEGREGFRLKIEHLGNAPSWFRFEVTSGDPNEIEVPGDGVLGPFHNPEDTTRTVTLWLNEDVPHREYAIKISSFSVDDPALQGESKTVLLSDAPGHGNGLDGQVGVPTAPLALIILAIVAIRRAQGQ